MKIIDTYENKNLLNAKAYTDEYYIYFTPENVNFTQLLGLSKIQSALTDEKQDNSKFHYIGKLTDIKFRIATTTYITGNLIQLYTENKKVNRDSYLSELVLEFTDNKKKSYYLINNNYFFISEKIFNTELIKISSAYQIKKNKLTYIDIDNLVKYLDPRNINMINGTIQQFISISNEEMKNTIFEDPLKEKMNTEYAVQKYANVLKFLGSIRIIFDYEEFFNKQLKEYFLSLIHQELDNAKCISSVIQSI